jgi:CheY-like chemotaxis protein
MKKNILLVDDDYVFNFLTRTVIVKMGFADDIKVALNGQEALNLINEHQEQSGCLPDFIFLDLNMPIMSGFEFLETFKKMTFEGKEKIRIAIVTSSSDIGDMEKAHSYGIRHFIPKPITEKAINSFILQEY